MMSTPQILRFGAVGVIGFCIDGGLLWLLISSNSSPLTARLISFPAAVCATWALNRHFTFVGAEKTNPVAQLNFYFGVQIAGSIANFAVYITVLSMLESNATNAILALAIGAVLGLVVNYFGSKKIVFVKKNSRSETRRSVQE